MGESESLFIQALEESNELLVEENARLRNTNRILRSVNSGLRSKLEIAQKNDEEFQSLCQSEPEPEETKTSWGSYPINVLSPVFEHRLSVADATGVSYEVEPLEELITDAAALKQLRKNSSY